MTDLPTPGRRGQHQPGRPPGRPLAFLAVIDHTETGDPITAADIFVDLIGRGESIAVAAMAACMTKDTALRCLRDGAAISKWIAAGRRDEANLTATEQHLLAFSRRFTVAHSRGERAHAALRWQAARGGTVLTTRTTTTKAVLDPDGNQTGTEVTTVVREETLGPDHTMLRWMAERRHPEAYGAQLRVDVNLAPDRDPFMPDEVDRLRFLAADAQAHLDDETDGQVIDTTLSGA